MNKITGVVRLSSGPLRISKAGNKYTLGRMLWGQGKEMGFFASGRVAELVTEAEGAPFFINGFLRNSVTPEGKIVEATLSEVFPVEGGSEWVLLELTGFYKDGKLEVLISRGGEKSEVAEIPLSLPEGIKVAQGERIYVYGGLGRGRAEVTRVIRNKKK